MIRSRSDVTTVLSLGAGVQSSTLALMAAVGEITPMPEVAIFADTGWEPRAVYDWLGWLEGQLPFPVVRVSQGNLRDAQIQARMHGKRTEGVRWASLPYFILGPDGERGMVRRQCTSEYKIAPIERYIKREILGLKPRQRTPKSHVLDQWFGISLDEIQRQKVPFVEPWRRNVYPLIERRLTRGHCLEWMEKKGFPQPPRSACLGCPFHSDEEWLRIKEGPPDEWQSVVEFDRQIRHAEGMRGQTFLHCDRVPIDEVDLTTPRTAGQLSLLDECDGMCGV